MTELAKNPFWFLRHGETDWNAQGLSQGSVDIPLNATGFSQARQAAALLRRHGITTIVASSLSRARETARVVGEALGVTYSTDPDLREASFGDQEGEIMGAWYDDWVAGRYTPTGGESFAVLRARVIPAVNRALARPAPVLIVAHGAMFRAVRASMGLSARVRTQNGEVLRCEPGDAWSVK